VYVNQQEKISAYELFMRLSLLVTVHRRTTQDLSSVSKEKRLDDENEDLKKQLEENKAKEEAEQRGRAKKKKTWTI